MSRKVKPDERKTSLGGKVKFQGFLNLKLSREEKKAVRQNPVPTDMHSQILADAATSGYKVSFTYSTASDCYIVTLYGNRDKHPDAGWALSARHVDFSTCFDIISWCLDEAGKAGSLTDWLGDEDEVAW